ncbi:hypothetical protein SUGI_0364240 [Cryptomeria japonica]|nr:hypothetical protein SUGI_0364240 [Cryptomeria japonica]
MNQQNHTFQKLLGTLFKATESVEKCENVSPLNVFMNWGYASQVLKLEKGINGYILHHFSAAMLLDMKNLVTDLKDYPYENTLKLHWSEGCLITVVFKLAWEAVGKELSFGFCDDYEVKGILGSIVVIITVSQSPNLEGI